MPKHWADDLRVFEFVEPMAVISSPKAVSMKLGCLGWKPVCKRLVKIFCPLRVSRLLEALNVLIDANKSLVG